MSTGYTITFADIADWHQQISERSGIDAAHKALKVWRKFWKVMQSLRFTQLSDPSAGIRNRQPPPRDQRFLHGEAVRLAKRAWRDGYLGLACIIITAWDTGFSPIDCRTLRRRHLGIDPKTGRIFFDRSGEGREKTGVAVIGTLSRFGDRLVRTYLERFGAEHHAESLLFRMRSGVAYQESRLGSDFAEIRERVFPGDKRQLRDMRRSGVMETFTGGAKPRMSRRNSAIRSIARTSSSRPTVPSILRRCVRPTRSGSKETPPPEQKLT